MSSCLSRLLVLVLLVWIPLTPTAAFQTNAPYHQASTGTTTSSLSMAKASNMGGDLESLFRENRAMVDSLASVAAEEEEDVSELVCLRFALAFDSLDEASEALKESMAWRKGKGKDIVTSAAQAVAQAKEGATGWDNEPVRNAAPHADRINKFIEPSNVLTLARDDGNLVYIIRASAIDDKELMDQVSVAELGEFFCYVKEVHSLIANERSENTGKLCEVIFANDITGVRQVPDKRFSKGLTESSAQYETLYPSLAGPTMILNLPFILQAFIALFKPLFPKTVQARLKFARAPVLARCTDMSALSKERIARDSFLAEVKSLLEED